MNRVQFSSWYKFIIAVQYNTENNPAQTAFIQQLYNIYNIEMTIYGKNSISNEKLLLTRCWGVLHQEGTSKHFYERLMSKVCWLWGDFCQRKSNFHGSQMY